MRRSTKGITIKRFTSEEEDALRRDYLDHVETPEIARRLGRSVGVIRQKVLQFGLTRDSGVTFALRYAPPDLAATRHQMSDDEFIARAKEWRREIGKRKKAERDARVGATIAAIDAEDGSRATKMRAMRDAGATLQEIADRYGITRERVRQVVSTKYMRWLADRQARDAQRRGPPIRTIFRFWQRMHPAHQKQFLDAIGAELRPPRDEEEILWS